MKYANELIKIAKDLESIDKKQIDRKIVPSNIRIDQQNLMHSMIAILQVFFGNDIDNRNGLQRLQSLLGGNRTGINTSKLLPKEKEHMANVITKNIWLRFYNMLPDKISTPTQYLRGAFTIMMKSLFGVERYKRAVYEMMDKKLNINVEDLGYEGIKKQRLFLRLYANLKQAIKSSIPMAISRMD